jgi:hypothetical protein
MLKERIEYIENLLNDAGVGDYGMTREEILNMLGRESEYDILSLILKLKQLSDNGNRPAIAWVKNAEESQNELERMISNKDEESGRNYY